MDLLSDVFGEKALRDPDLRLPRDRGGTEHRAGSFRVIDVVGLEEEGAAFTSSDFARMLGTIPPFSSGRVSGLEWCFTTFCRAR